MAKTEVGAMVRGMGMGMKVLELLTKEIYAQGGQEEILSFLTRPRFEGNLRMIVRKMIECDWRIPASEMRDLAEKYYRDEFEVEEEFIPEVRNLWWFDPLYTFGIPFERFSNPEIDEGELPIPSSLLEELDGKIMEYPLKLRGGEYVVVDWGHAGQEMIKPGERINARGLTHLAIAEARYFDFDR